MASGADGAAPEALLDRVRERLAAAGGEVTASRVAAAVRAEGALRGDHELLAIVRAMQQEVAGAGPLAPLLADPEVTDVLINAPDDVWVDRGGDGLRRAAVRFADDSAVRRLVQRLIGPTGRRLDAAQPWVDARLPDGTRVHAVLPPLARATCVSLRRQRHRVFTLDELRSAGSLTAHLADLLAQLVAARLAIVISGGTGSGKTTLLSALLSIVDERERIVLVEDAGELRPDRPHVVRLEARPPNVEGAGEVTLRDLVRQALRMRPDRLVVGEARGAEVAEMLAAMNTGHDGGMTTLHANATSDVPARLEALGAIAGLSRDALHAQAAAAIDVCVHLRRGRDGLRRVSEVAVCERTGSGEVEFTAALSDAALGQDRVGPGAPALAALLAAREVTWRPPRGPVVRRPRAR